MSMNVQDKTVLYLSDLPFNIIINDVELFLSKYKDKIMFINIDQNKRSIEKRRPLAIKVVFRDSESANKCRLEMNLQKLKGKSVRIMWDEQESSIRYNTKNNIFIKGIPKDTTPREVYEYFLKYGDISSAKINEDERGVHSGYGYITYYNQADAEKAIQETNGKIIWNSKIDVSHFQKKNERGYPEAALDSQKIYVSNLPKNYTESDLRKLCDEISPVQGCEIQIDNMGAKFGIVLFGSDQEAKEVVSKLSGREINGSKLIVEVFQKKYIHRQFQQNKTAKLVKQYRDCDLHIRNIPHTATDEDLIKIFSKFGVVNSAKIEKEYIERKNKETGEVKKELASKGFGYVQFTNPDSAKKAMEELNGRYLPGFESWNRTLIINIFRPKYERQTLLTSSNMYENPSSPLMYPNQQGQGFSVMYPGAGQINAPMNVPYHFRNAFPGQRTMFPNKNMGAGYQGNMGYNNYGGYRNNNNRYQQRGRGGYRSGYNKNNNNNNNNNNKMQNQNQNQNLAQNQGQSAIEDEKKRNFDFEEFNKLQTVEEKKDFLGEELFKAIEESPIIASKGIGVDTIGKITGMMLELPDHNEVIDIIQTPSILQSRIQEALNLLKANS